MTTRIESDRKYTGTHEWVKIEDRTMTVGVTDFAQHQLSDLVYIELPQVGVDVNKGSVLVTLESVKTVGEVYAPVSGEIMTVNTALEEHPDLVNTDPYGAGWLVTIFAANPDEASADLLDAAAYREFVERHA